MSYFFLAAKILLGVGLVAAYLIVVHPWALHLLYRSIQKGWRTGKTNGAMYVFIPLALLLLPVLLPGFLSVVRLCYATMAIIVIQKLISYLREHGWPQGPVEPKGEFFDFMNGYTTNYTERAEPLEKGEEAPNPAYFMRRAVLKYATVAAVIVLNVTLGLWRYTPPLAATLAKVLCAILFFHATQDLLRARLVRRGLRPDVVLVDLKLFWSRTYELVLLRTNPIIYRWLLRYVYIPLGGKNHPIRNIMACYLLSGLWHEYMLSVASMKVSGLWFAYFAVNGLILCVESLLRPRRERLLLRLKEGSLGHHVARSVFPLVNFALNVCVAHLLFLGLDQIVAFH